MTSTKYVMGRKTVTLMELVMAIALLGVIVLGAASFGLVGRSFLHSSSRRAQLLNEQNLIIEHIASRVVQATGYFEDQGLDASAGTSLRVRYDINGTPYDFTDDRWADYSLAGNVFTGDSDDLSHRVMSFRVSRPQINRIQIDELTLRYFPGRAIDPRNNPEIMIDPLEPVHISSLCHSID